MNTFYKRMIFQWRFLESVPAAADGGAGGGPSSGAPPADTGGMDGDSSLFSDLASHDEDAGEAPSTPSTPPAVVPPVSGPAAVSPPAVGAVPPATGSPSPVPGAAPATTAPTAVPPVPPAASGTQQPPASSAPPGDPATAATPPAPIDFAKHREEMLPKLASLYGIDEADVEALRTSPEKVLPTLAARMHYEVQHAVFAGVMNALPRMMELYSSQNKEFEANETAFFSQFPALKEKPEYAQTVLDTIKAVKMAAPNLSRDDLIRRAGIMASVTLGLPLAGAAPAAAAPGAIPAVVPAAIPAYGRPAGVGTVGHVVPPLAPGEGGPQSDIDALVEAHIGGDI